jgi:hypothetical protein
VNGHSLSFMMLLVSTPPIAAQITPVADHHQHLFSPAMVTLLDTTHSQPPITARDMVALLDSAGIRRALMLSVAYIYGSPSRPSKTNTPRFGPRTTGMRPRRRSIPTACARSAASIR